jgi:hypothetical protein
MSLPFLACHRGSLPSSLKSRSLGSSRHFPKTTIKWATVKSGLAWKNWLAASKVRLAGEAVFSYLSGGSLSILVQP